MLAPSAVIMVGIAFGRDEQKQTIGDILVSQQLCLYELTRVGKDTRILRGDKPHATSWLVDLFKSASLLWNGPRVLFGVVMTGDKLVDNLEFRDQLYTLEPEAIGGEMEGAGLYVACHEKKVDWILVKAICDWGNGNKTYDNVARQQTAAQNAAAFVLHALQSVPVDWDKRRPQSDYLNRIGEATSISTLLGQLDALVNSGKVDKIANMLEILVGKKCQEVVDGSKHENMVERIDIEKTLKFSYLSSAIGNPLPIVDGCILRAPLVSSLTKLFREQRILFLYGSSGIGKSNLASLITKEVNEKWGWASFRDLQTDQIKDVLARTVLEIAASELQPYLVLDDINFNKVSLFEREFISLVFSIINANGMVIIAGATPPPTQLLPKLRRTETCIISVPPFDEIEIEEMIHAHGLSDDKLALAWARVILLTTSGHPQLVHARVRNLRAKGWPSLEPSELVNTEDVETVRSEARTRFANEFPTEDTRILGYRLTLMNGAFERQTAMAVAQSPPAIVLPGEAFDALIGPWIEREEENRFRVSPLLAGAARNALSETDIKAVHGAIAKNIISKKEIDQIDFGTAFFHAYMGKNVNLLLNLTLKIVTIINREAFQLYDSMSWFTAVALDKGEKLYPEDSNLDLMLRLAQFKISTAAPEPNKVLPVIERIEDTLNEIEPSAAKVNSEFLAYGTILNTINIHIPSSIVIRMLSRIIDLTGEDLALKDMTDHLAKYQDGLPRIGDNKPVQLLFSFQATRIKGLDDLYELIEALDSLSPEKRGTLLSVCNSEMDFTTLLVNSAWSKEVRDGAIDIEKTLGVLDYAERKSREWNADELNKVCLVAISVIYNEYGNNKEKALEILDIADIKYPNDAKLLNQRAKVLFRAEDNSDALPIASKALTTPGLSSVDFVFCCRSAGIGAAKVEDWKQAEHYFSLGFEKAMRSSIQKSMGVGLMADAAFALWKQGKYKESLLLYATVLDSLADIPLSDNIVIRHLHATIRHSVSWISFDARGKYPPDFIEPPPGVCSNQEPHKGIQNFKIVELSVAWGMLEITEQILELNLGIKIRSQKAIGQKELLIIERYRRSVDYELIFRNKVFDEFIPKLIRMVEMLPLHNSIEEKEEVNMDIGNIPKLPKDYWSHENNRAQICRYLLFASIVATAAKQEMPLPIDRWCADLKKTGINYDDIDQFLNVLNGASPNISPFQQVAAALFKLRSGSLFLKDLYECSFHLLGFCEKEKSYASSALESLLKERWLNATIKQRASFSSPSIICPAVEKICLDPSLKGLAKIASILKITAPYINIQLAPSAIEILERIINDRAILV